MDTQWIVLGAFFALILGVFLPLGLVAAVRSSGRTRRVQRLEDHRAINELVDQGVLTNVERLEFSGRIYVRAHWGERLMNFKVRAIAENDWLGPMPGQGNLSLVIRTKLQGTQEQPGVHLAVFEQDQSILRSVLGWTHVGPGIYLGEAPGVSDTEQEQAFGQLSDDSIEALRSLATASGGGVSVSQDWEKVMVGDDAAVALVGGDPGVVEQLDLQTKLPMNLSPEHLSEHLVVLDAVAQLIEGDLSHTT